MGSHLVGSFQFQASVVKHVVTLSTLLSRTCLLDIPSFLGEYLLEGFLDLDSQKISNKWRAEHPSEKMKLYAYAVKNGFLNMKAHSK
jgi:hypothetical protein